MTGIPLNLKQLSLSRRLLGLFLLMLLLGGCASDSARGRVSQRDGAPVRAVDISKIPEPIPKFEALARYGNKSPYEVLGKRYSLLPSRSGYQALGTASWYGTKFHGRLTSNREPYDMYQFTAAHKTLPIPAYAEVTNLDNGRKLIVRINDRGPFVDDRIIDLSYAAAIKLDMHVKGTARVQVRTITPGEVSAATVSSPQPAPANVPAPAPVAVPNRTPPIDDQLVVVQCGAFSDKSNASALSLQLLDAGFSDARAIAGQDGLFRVVIGPLANRDSFESLRGALVQAGCNSPKAVSAHTF